MALALGLVVAVCLALLAGVAWLSRSWAVTLVATAVLALLLRFPGVQVWRREALPRLQARHRALRMR